MARRAAHGQAQLDVQRAHGGWPGVRSGRQGVVTGRQAWPDTGGRQPDTAICARGQRQPAVKDYWAAGLLALLKYPFYPLFNFDNDMNLISKSLTILTSAQLLVVFTFAHIFWRYFVFAGF